MGRNSILDGGMLQLAAVMQVVSSIFRYGVARCTHPSLLIAPHQLWCYNRSNIIQKIIGRYLCLGSTEISNFASHPSCYSSRGGVQQQQQVIAHVCKLAWQYPILVSYHNLQLSLWMLETKLYTWCTQLGIGILSSVEGADPTLPKKFPAGQDHGVHIHETGELAYAPHQLCSATLSTCVSQATGSTPTSSVLAKTAQAYEFIFLP